MAETKLNLENTDEQSLSNVFGGYSEKMNINEKSEMTDFQKTIASQMNQIDPDLVVDFDVVKLPSKGIFYKNGIKEVEVEYLTSKDEDILSTQALIESGRVFDVILKRKIKTKGVEIDKLLTGDKNAILLFLRMSSYGHEYDVEVTDPRTGYPFKETVDLRRLTYKTPDINPDFEGLFEVHIPKRNKLVKFKLLNSEEEKRVLETADNMRTAYNTEYSEYGTLKLVSQIVDIDGKRDKLYIRSFVEAMPAIDALTIRKKILEVTPDVNMSYEFTAKDGFKFKSTLVVGVDFFFPSI